MDQVGGSGSPRGGEGKVPCNAGGVVLDDSTDGTAYDGTLLKNGGILCRCTGRLGRSLAARKRDCHNLEYDPYTH